MTISSRTYGGIPHRCPTCGHEEDMEVSITLGDSCCPACGQLKWVQEHSTGPERIPRRKSQRKTRKAPAQAEPEKTIRPVAAAHQKGLVGLISKLMNWILPKEAEPNWYPQEVIDPTARHRH